MSPDKEMHILNVLVGAKLERGKATTLKQALKALKKMEK